MKRFVLASLSALTLMGSLATTADAQPGQYNNGRNDNNGRSDNNRNDNDRRGDNNRRTDNRTWDDRQYNGYTLNGRWNYGPPPAAVRNQAQFGFHQWRRGERLPSYYRSHYREIDWRREHLRAPSRGYHYVRDDRGNTLLVAVATGVILSAILSSH